MAFESNIITVIGNTTDAPELRFTQGGHAVATLTVAHNHKRGEGKDDETTFVRVNCWRDLAENVAESIGKGDRVVVIGRLRIRSYDKDGETKWITEVEADEVAPSLRWARVSVAGKQGDRSGFTPPAPSDTDVPF